MSGLNLDSHLKAFMASLHKLQETEVMTDVTLILPDQSAIPCHKVVLMAASPFFETMFQSGLKEGAEQDIQLDFADADTIKTLVKFIYTGNIELTVENIETIVAASEFLCCTHLKAHCEEYLVDNVGFSNCIDYYRYGKVFNLELLIRTAFDFILSQFREFKEISDFVKLTEDELVEAVSSDRLNAENEDVVFEAVVHWVNADPDVRENVFPRIASLIRFPFCAQATLTDNICCNSLMLKSGCIELAHEALWSQFHFNCNPPIHNSRSFPRFAFKPPLFRLIESGSPASVSLSATLCVDGSTIKWETIMPAITSTLEKVITCPSGLYWIDDKDCCYFLDTKTTELSSYHWKPTNKDSTLAFIDGKIFAIGEKPKSKSVKSINVIEETNPEWKSEQEMLHEVSRPYVVHFANKVYVFDGYNAKVTQEFDPELNEWRLRSEMPGICYNCAAVALDDKIYVVGGVQRVCYSYDPAKDEWKTHSQPRYRFTTAAVWNGKILLGNAKHVAEYDPVMDRWSNKDQLIPHYNINEMVLHASYTL